MMKSTGYYAGQALKPVALAPQVFFLILLAGCGDPVLPEPELSIMPESLALTVVKGRDVRPVGFTVENSGEGTLEWTATASASWLQLEPQSGTGPAEVEVFLEGRLVGELPPGEYRETLRVSTRGAEAKIPVLVTVREPTEWGQVSAGGWHTCAITAAEVLYCWGLGSHGRLGTGDRMDRTRPALVVGGRRWTQVSAGEDHTCGVNVVGEIYCWGDNEHGQLGTGDRGVQIQPAPVYGADTRTWIHVSAGNRHTCGLTEDREAFCWGRGDGGLLGTGESADSSMPQPVAGGYRWNDLDGEELHRCGVTSEREIYCWGNGSSGQLGTGERASSSEPAEPVLGEHSWVELSAGRAHTCGVNAAGDLLCWGAGTAGQLGRGLKGDQLDPRAVRGDFAWSRVTAHGDYACGLTMGGTAYCWGHNRFGDLGIGSAQDVAGEPTPVAGDHRWSSLSAGGYGACGVTLDGKAYCWGSGSYGRIGDGSTEPTRVPVRVSEPE